MDGFMVGYAAWAREHRHVLQISISRSGSTWLGSMVAWVLGQKQMYIGRVLPDIQDIYVMGHADPVGDWWLPDGRFVLIIRDPRSVLWSTMDFERRVHNIEQPAIGWWENLIFGYRRVIETFLPLDTLVVQYEHLCLDAEKVVEKVVDFTGYEIVESSAVATAKQLSGMDNYLKQCFKWRNNMNSAVVCGIWRHLKDIMIHYGYTEFGHAKKIFNF